MHKPEKVASKRIFFIKQFRIKFLIEFLSHYLKKNLIAVINRINAIKASKIHMLPG